MTLIAVAGLSARLMAEAAQRDGFEVVALDLFGDADLRRAAVEWHPLGAAPGLRIDAARTLAALRELAARGGVAGWVAGSGFEGLPHLLAHGARLLPLFGTAACDVRRLRDPATFFAFLDEHGTPHPPVAFQRPADATGWLLKDAHGSGGWFIRDAADAPATVAPQRYFQRRANGVAMSATFIANGERAVVLGLNELTVRQHGTTPFVYCGATGPVDVLCTVVAQVERALQVLTSGFRLRGLGSLDFLCDGSRIDVLEVNPRPPASMALYDGRVPGGLMAAHVAACRDGALPVAVLPAFDVRGHETVFAPQAVQIHAEDARTIAQWPGSHDLPAAGTRLAAGEPLCSLSASAASAAAVRAALAASRESLLARVNNRETVT